MADNNSKRYFILWANTHECSTFIAKKLNKLLCRNDKKFMSSRWFLFTKLYANVTNEQTLDLEKLNVLYNQWETLKVQSVDRYGRTGLTSNKRKTCLNYAIASVCFVSILRFGSNLNGTSTTCPSFPFGYSNCIASYLQLGTYYASINILMQDGAIIQFTSYNLYPIICFNSPPLYTLTLRCVAITIVWIKWMALQFFIFRSYRLRPCYSLSRL